MIDLNEYRKNADMTQAELAQKVGVDISTISKIESGVRRPSVSVAKAIAAALDFDWTEFYNDPPDTTIPA